MAAEGRSRRAVLLVLGALLLGALLARLLGSRRAAEPPEPPPAIEAAAGAPRAARVAPPPVARRARASATSEPAPATGSGPASPSPSAEPAAPSETAVPMTVDVIVRARDDGRAIAGATVRGGNRWDGPTRTAPPGMGAPADGIATTDAEGRATLPYARIAGHQVEAVAPGFTVGQTYIVTGAGGAETPVVIDLERAVESIAGIAIDRDARPVAGLLVVASADRGDGAPGGPEVARATTGADGWFRMEGVRAGPEAWVVVDALGAAPAGAPDPFTTTRASAVRWCPAEGRGIDPHGRLLEGCLTLVVGPAPSIRFRLVPPPGSGLPAIGTLRLAQPSRRWDVGTAFGVAPDGRACVEVRSTGIGSVFTVEADGFALAWFISIAAPGRADAPEVDVPLALPGRVAGHVLDADGKPVSGVKVAGIAIPPGAVTSQAKGVTLQVTVAETLSGADGRFSLEGLPRVSGIRATTADDRGVIARSAWAEVEDLAPGGSREVDLTLRYQMRGDW